MEAVIDLKQGESCVIKDTPDANICGENKYTLLTTQYTFSINPRARKTFSMPICKGHYDALLARLGTNDLAQYLKK